eukprot:12921480-Heterocapsa_arctica.AAC.1
MSELKETVAMNKSDNIVKDMIRLLFDTSLFNPGLNFDQWMYIVGDIHHKVFNIKGDIDHIGLMDEYAPQQLKKLDGKTLRSMRKEGLDYDNEDERERPNELKKKFELPPMNDMFDKI